MAMSAADKRKMRRLEEELEEAEKQKKSFERKAQNLQRDFEELNEKYEALVKQQSTAEWSAKKTEVILDNKSLERNVKTLEEEIERLRKELKEQKDKKAAVQKESREQIRQEVDKTVVNRDLQNQIDEYKRQLENERERFKQEFNAMKEEYEKKNELEKRQQRRTNAEIRVRDMKASSSGTKTFDSFSKSFGSAEASQEVTQELKTLRTKVEEYETASEKQKKKFDKELNELKEKINEANTQKERSEKKMQKAEEESKRVATELEKEKKAKFDLEREKYQYTRDLRDTQRLLNLATDEKAKQREEIARLEQQIVQIKDSSKEAFNNSIKYERELAQLKKSFEEDSDRNKISIDRKVASLERDLDEWKKRAQKTESSESSLVIENRKLTTEVDKLKSQLEQQAIDFDREKSKLERQLSNANKTYNEEIERLRDDIKKLDDRRKREVKSLEDLQARADEAIAQRKATVNQTLEKVKAETDTLKMEMEKSQQGGSGGKWKEMLELKEKQFDEELNDVRQKMKEKEKAWREEKERMVEEEKEREKEWTAERKRNAEREKKRNQEFEDLNTELIDEKHAKQQLEDHLRKALDDIRQLNNDVEDAKEEHKIDNEKNGAKLKHLQEENSELQNENHDLSNDLRKAEAMYRDLEDDVRKVKRELEDSKLILDETKEKLNQTQALLEKTILEDKQKIESLEQKLIVVQNEANDERKEKERQTKLRAEFERRLAELEWYFLPDGDQVAQPDFHTPAYKLIQKRKKELASELDEIKKRHAHKPESVDGLHARLVDGLRNIPESNKEVTAYQLQGLMQALEAADFPIRNRLKVCVALVEGLVDPEIIRELRLQTEFMVDSSVHFLDTPESVVNYAMRDIEEQKARPDYNLIKRSEILTFRDALLNRLAKIRARRMRRSKVEVKEGILQELYTKGDL